MKTTHHNYTTFAKPAIAIETPLVARVTIETTKKRPKAYEVVFGYSDCVTRSLDREHVRKFCEDFIALDNQILTDFPEEEK